MTVRGLALTLALAAASLAAGAENVPGSISRSLIAPGDMLDISIFYSQEMHTQTRVSNDGNVTLPLVGSMHIAGLDPTDAGKQIADRLVTGGYYKMRPSVTVAVTDPAAQRVTVLGEVSRPGSIPLFGDQHLLNIISAAGGLTAAASGEVSLSHRDATGKIETLHVRGPLTSIDNPEIRSGDTIMVEKAGIVYVVGGVVRAGGFALDQGKSVSVLQALALAEGAAPNAKMGSAKIIRAEDGRRDEIPVDLKAMLRGNKQDVILRPDDILFIPDSKARTVLERGAETAMGIAAGVAIYHF